MYGAAMVNTSFKDFVFLFPILEDPTLKFISIYLDFNNNLCESFYVRPQALLLSFDDLDQGGLRRDHLLWAMKHAGKPLTKLCLGCNASIWQAIEPHHF